MSDEPGCGTVLFFLLLFVAVVNFSGPDTKVAEKAEPVDKWVCVRDGETIIDGEFGRDRVDRVDKIIVFKMPDNSVRLVMDADSCTVKPVEEPAPAPPAASARRDPPPAYEPKDPKVAN